ncbi:hypothetical protein SAMN05444392_102279 [Seinonella peptonophila]|uniref:Uncharacterized protein n=1 Tax=Seinonella peptonophila TaxID=112248 RepID=A0A1M4VBK5_9BACL|nr:hypothetical protein [Seinonella peptonophila]SHE66329.1 hypothetical protein SAMN05444392_102279 [Seinonella peptonophila]
MAEFRSDAFPELGIWVNGNRYKFSNGRLRTNDEEVIKQLTSTSGIVRVDEPKKEPKQDKPKPTLKKSSSKKAK